MLSKDSQMDTICLSLGGQLSIPDWQLRGSYATGTEAQIVIRDDAGAELARFDGTVTKVGISFLEEPDAVKDIPHGANFQLLVTVPGEEPEAKRYGTVIRKEPRFPLAEVVQPEDVARIYKADFIGQYIGPMWKPMGGKGSLAIHTHGLISNLPSMGPNFALFSDAAARWLWPMNMDSVSINVKVLNVGAGKFTVAVCADYAMNTWLGIQFETGIVNNKVHIVTGTGPITAVYQDNAVANTTANGDVYTIKYNALSNTIACYKGTSLTPLIEWTDEDGVVPHGEGFRYTGLIWNTSLFTPGVEPTSWEAHDGV